MKTLFRLAPWIRLQAQRGFSIIEVLVAIGIMSVLTMGVITLISNQTTSMQAMDEKMAMQNVQTHVMNVLSSSAFCKCLIGPTRVFDYSGSRTWDSFPTSIASAFDPSCAEIGSAYLTVNTPLLPRLKPTAMSLQNVTETTAGSGNFSANLSIEFDQSLLTRARKNLSLPIYFTVNMADPVNARRLGTCAAVVATANIDLPALCADIGGVYNGAATPQCQPTYQ